MQYTNTQNNDSQANTENLHAKIFVSGSGGMVGTSIVRALKAEGYRNIHTARHSELDLSNQAATQEYFTAERFDRVYVASAKVGGIHANNIQPAEFIYENIMIAGNIIHASFLTDVDRVLFLGSSCIYPRNAEQPMAEDCLLTGSLEPTNEPYAIAKIAGIKLCESYNRQYDTDYRSIMPTNLYGPGDNFHLEHSHVIPALIHKFHRAKQLGEKTVRLWGTGNPRREFLHVWDLADACIHFMKMPKADYQAGVDPRSSHINIGTGSDVSLRELASVIQELTGFEGEVHWDTSMPDGTARKLLNVSRAQSMGWKARTSLSEGLKQTYAWFLEHIDTIRK